MSARERCPGGQFPTHYAESNLYNVLGYFPRCRQILSQKLRWNWHAHCKSERVTVSSAARDRRWSAAWVRHWPLWSLAPGARAYVIATVLAAAAATVVAAWHTSWHPSQVPGYVVLL